MTSNGNLRICRILINFLGLTMFFLGFPRVSLVDIEPSLDIFVEDKIVDDLIDIPPQSLLHVEFETISLHPQQELTQAITNRQPDVVEWTSKHSSMYSLMLVDPDATSRENPNFRSVVHWMIVNIPSGGEQKGDTVAAYHGPRPPKDSGLHRYVFLVFEQLSGRINVTSLKFTEYEGIHYVFNFSLRDFLITYDLSKTPTAGNYFLCQYQETSSET